MVLLLWQHVYKLGRRLLHWHGFVPPERDELQSDGSVNTEQGGQASGPARGVGYSCLGEELFLPKLFSILVL